MCAVAAIGSGVSAPMSALNDERLTSPPPFQVECCGTVFRDTQLVTHRRKCSDQTCYVCCAGWGAMRSRQRPGEVVRKPADAV